jgi:hypothetical protein
MCHPSTELCGTDAQPLVLRHWSSCRASTPTGSPRCFGASKRHLLLDTSHSLWLSSRRQTMGSNMATVETEISSPGSSCSEALRAHAHLPRYHHMQCSGLPVCMCFLGQRTMVVPWLSGGRVHDCHHQPICSRRCTAPTGCTKQMLPRCCGS